MHVLESNFIAVNIFQVIFERFDSIRSIVLLRTLLAKITDDYAVFHLLFIVAKLGGGEGVVGQSAVQIFVLGEAQRIDLGELMSD
jgi:hypothetical protein